MSKADKRNFRLYAKRVQSDDSMKFLQLFDVLDKLDELDEKKITLRMGKIGKGKLSNLKRHLYSQILTSLRLINSSRIKSIEVREQIDYAHVLYARGLYHQSLKLLQRCKGIAIKEELDVSVLEIIEFQKLIESRHITNTGPIKNDALTFEAKEKLDIVTTSVLISNLRVRLHGYYIKNSHVKNEKEKEEIIRFLEDNLPPVEIDKLGYMEQIYLYQCFVWYYYILLDFEKCYEYAHRWIHVFDQRPELKSVDPDLYMRGYHYLLTAAFNFEDRDNLEKHLRSLEQFRKVNYARFNENSKIFSFLYVHWARYNLHFLDFTFDKGIELIARTLRRIRRYQGRIASHRVMVMYYKIAWLYLANGDPGRAVNYLHKIINGDKEHFREDIQIYSRILFLMAHYDLENVDLMSYLTKNAEAFFKTIRSSNKLQKRCLQFFKKIGEVGISDRSVLMMDFYEDLKKIKNDQFERRSFIYLDITSWVEAKISKKSMVEMKKAV